MFIKQIKTLENFIQLLNKKKHPLRGDFLMVIDKPPLDLRFFNIFIFQILTK